MFISMFNPIFKENDQGQKYPGSCAFAEPELLSYRNGMERMCQCHGSIQNSHPPVLVQKRLCNQFIHNHISSRGFFGINHFKLRNFAVVVIYWVFFVPVDRGSIMARIHRRSVMIYGSLQAEFMETKCNSDIHRYGTPIFGKIVVNISKPINNNNQIFCGRKI